jgi:phosphoserine phosphatase RsbU/P
VTDRPPVPADELPQSTEELYESAPCGHLSMLPDGTVVRANRTFLQWSGYTREEVVGRRFVDLLSTGGRIYHETHYAPLLKMQGAVREIALELVRGDGSRMPVLVNSALRRDAAGEPVAIQAVVFGAEDRREYERELRRARDREQQARERSEALQAAMGRLAQENAVLYERERSVAATLQASMLAGDLPRDARLAVAAHYSPGVETLDVGGDWYDAIRLDDDAIGLVVGDVVGRGIDAAAAMGQLRSATRALACTELAPARLLEQIDRFVDHVPAAWMATVVYADVDLRRGTVRYASAGHLPPLVVQPGERPELLWPGGSTPLGVRGSGRERAEDVVALRPGARLLLFTDGLVERRDRALDDGLAALVETVERLGSMPLERVVAQLPHRMGAADGGEDDVCLLGVELQAG